MGQHNCKRCKKSLVSKIFFRRDHFIRQEIISVLSFEQDDGQRHVTTILNLHDRWKKLKHGKHCSEVLERRMLHHAAKLCYYWWLSNSNLVCQVLYRIYRLESHFPIVYNHVITNGEPQTDDWPIPIARCNVEPNEYARIIYFLRHANNCKMTINGVRFPDLPTSSFYWLPPWISAVLKKYIRNDLQLQSSILIVKLLLRIIPQLQQRDMKLPDMTEIRSFVDDLSERGIIWNLRRRYLQPSELHHLCRCVIRRHLRKMWKLPLGIFELPLPNLLQKYLNLEDD
ncbi:uncharacterized protein LOC111637607 [Centruroides sculpturatus]|uniref:uncharacterized protein LOC111637607 n=1 Tax=Centruroides sculpturatus TaxID=218467 RepID=UPI000C6D33AF|nr:uncharacterized protein LOC111637607 [Centruroides sculpturatus]